LLRRDGFRETNDIEHRRVIGAVDIDALTYDQKLNNPLKNGGGERIGDEGVPMMRERLDRVYVRGLADDDNDFTTRVEKMQRKKMVSFWSDHFAVVSTVVFDKRGCGGSSGDGGGRGGSRGGSGGGGDIGGNNCGGKQKRDDVDDVLDLTGD
jgi:hypothetical protein